MKVKIKHFNGELPKYLTLDKVYEVSLTEGFKDLYDLKDDDEYTFSIRIEGCARLNGGSWEVVDE